MNLGIAILRSEDIARFIFGLTLEFYQFGIFYEYLFSGYSLGKLFQG